MPASQNTPDRQITGKINPNTASWASLARLPGIGPVRAQAIVTYREKCAGRVPTSRVFGSADDLARIKGIGPATITQISSYLAFDNP
jgi:competence protein ComEA